MAWPNPFRRTTENSRYCWGYRFEWSEKHLTPEQTEPLKHSYDVLGEECLDILNAIQIPEEKGTTGGVKETQKCGKDNAAQTGGCSPPSAPPQSPCPFRRDLYALLREHHASHPKLSQLWEEVNTVPEWVDWPQISRGQDVFYRYGGPALTALAYQSLLGGMGGRRVVETLARTGGFSVKAARRRLFETSQHIIQCTQSLESIQPGGAGHVSSVRVRLLHAAVRQRILTLTAKRPTYYDVAAWGVPINDLDQISTISSFSAALIWIGFPRQGIFLRAQEKADYVALWRYIGYVLGTPTSGFFDSPESAKRTMEALLWSEVDPSDTSRVLAANVVRSLENQAPTYASADMLIAAARWLNGNDLADQLGLPRVSLYYWALMMGQCLFFMTLCYVYRSVPYLDRRKLARLRRVFWHIIVEAKWGLDGTVTLFEFKHVPRLEGGGGGGGGEGEGAEKEKGRGLDDASPEMVQIKGSSVEARNLRVFAMFLGVLGLVGWLGWSAAVRVL